MGVKFVVTEVSGCPARFVHETIRIKISRDNATRGNEFVAGSPLPLAIVTRESDRKY